MAGAQDHRLAAAVCNAGGLGSLPAAALSPAELAAQLGDLTAATGGRPYNVNFFCHSPPEPLEPQHLAKWHETLTPYYQELGLDASEIPAGPGRVPFSSESADVLQDFKPAVVSFHFGLPPADLLERVKSWGSLVLSSATTVEEAQWLEAQGVDAVIAQGLEAGGHRGMFLTDDLTTQISTFALLPQVVQAVQIPVIAAGGICDPAGVRAVKALGAAAVQVGTAYLCTNEATTSTAHRAALQSPLALHTALTTLFSGRPARGIMNRLMRELTPLDNQAPPFPLAATGVAPLRAAGEAQGTGDFSPMWAGQNTSSCHNLPAAEVTTRLMDSWCLPS